MATLALDTVRVFELGDINEFVASTLIYQGAYVFAVKTTGTAAAGAVTISTHSFVGIAEAGALVGENVRVLSRCKCPLPVTGASAASVGAIVYASDDDTLTLTAATNVPVGYIARHISGTTCLVEFRATAERDIAVV